MQNLFFDTSGRLFEEPSNLLKQELKIPETYNAIITAITNGRSKLNEIAAKADIETSQCSKMLSTLISLGIVRSELFPGFINKQYVLFSKSGFTEALRNRAAAQGNILLTGVDDMFQPLL